MSRLPATGTQMLRRLERGVRSDRLMADLAQAAAAHQFEVWAVGGGLRDLLLARQAHDLDLISGRGQERLLNWLESRSSHRRVTFRKRIVTHRFTIDERPVDVVERGRRSLERELARRDFTVGAFAFDLVRWEAVDPWRGLSDLRRGRLSPPRDDAFQSDPLRLLRAVRLMAEHPQFSLTRRSLRLMREARRGLRRVAAERIRDELDRIMLAPRAARSIEQLGRLGLLDLLLPEHRRALGVEQNRYHHLDVWQHTVAAIAATGRLKQLSREELLVLRYALLLHDLGKPATRQRGAHGDWTFYNHERHSAEIVPQAARRWAWSRQREQAVATLVAQHLRLVIAPQSMSARALRRVARDVAPFGRLLAHHALADQAATRGIGWRRVRREMQQLTARFLAELSALEQQLAREPWLDGNRVMAQLQIGPGPEVGAILRQLEELRDDGVIGSREQAEAWLSAQANAAGRKSSRPPPPD